MGLRSAKKDVSVVRLWSFVGSDRVWVVGAESPLDFPGDLAGGWSRADDLVKRLRNQGLSGKGGYAEADVEVVTGP